MLRNRAFPVAAAAAVGGLLWWQTAGGRNQPVGHAERGNVPISETLEGLAGSGGPRAAHAHAEQRQSASHAKDTHIASHTPDSESKRSPTKSRDGI